MVWDVANELVSPPPRPGLVAKNMWWSEWSCLRNLGQGNRREGYLLGQDRGRLPCPYQWWFDLLALGLKPSPNSFPPTI